MASHLNRWAIAVALSFLAFNVPSTFAAGSGHSHSGSGHHQNNNSTQLPPFANSWPYLRAENGIFGPLWAAPGPGSLIGFGNGSGFVGGGGGWGGGGWGWGGRDRLRLLHGPHALLRLLPADVLRVRGWGDRAQDADAVPDGEHGL